MRQFLFFIAVIITGLAGSVSADNADAILDKIDTTRGICVLLGDRKAERARALAGKSELLIYVQLTRDEEVKAARRAADAAGLYNTRIFIEKGTLSRVHLADNLADVLIALDEAAKIPEAEALRVLRPGGTAWLGTKKLTRPFPTGIDDWSHPYHGPDNNPQSRDQIARAPYLTRFLADPRYAAVMQVAVASGGRVFKAFGNIAIHKREEPYLNTLVAFNGYNGTILWKRPLTPGIMVHRNTIIATPATIYLGDDKSCKLIDAATGEVKDEIAPSADIAGGTFWKWMALEDGVLYALTGEQEPKDPVTRWGRRAHGWLWEEVSKGFNAPVNPWGFGKTVLAIDPKTKKILWSHREDKAIDSRALCLKKGRIYLFRFETCLVCLDAKNGQVIWRKTPENDPRLFAALGKDLNRSYFDTSWRTAAYLKCSEKALYFAGPQVDKLLVVSAEDGSILWENPHNTFQLVLRDDGLYAISGELDDNMPSKKFDPLTGKVLAEIRLARRACTRPTGTIDALLFRATGGSTLLDAASNSPQLLSPMRPQCHDGVTIAHGMLYWWPSVCDCNFIISGVTGLGPAGDFNFSRKATEAERLEKIAADTKVVPLPETSADWPTFRANNQGTAATTAAVPDRIGILWQFTPPAEERPTAPVTAGGMVFTSGNRGIVRVLDAATGKQLWYAYTGGPVRLPPTIRQGRAFVGSGDGWVYAFEAGTGRPLWRFRAAPAERKIPVYGALLSTWPAASGVLVEDGTAYAAAGIVNYDGTHVYALDAATGTIKWQNNTSGHLNPELRTGASVHGHMLLTGGKLHLAGGNVVSPAIYDITDGKCLNNPAALKKFTRNNVLRSTAPRGWELFSFGDAVVAGGRPFYSDPAHEVFEASVINRMHFAPAADRDIVLVTEEGIARVTAFAPVDRKLLSERVKKRPARLKRWKPRFFWQSEPLWEYNRDKIIALAVGRNAAVIAGTSEITLLNIEDGKILTSQPLPSPPVPWGLAIDAEGRIIVTLENGRIICFGPQETT